MRPSSNTILVTGATSGIGLALAERWLARGNEVIVCGRREERLREIRERHPAMHTRVADVSTEAERVALFEWATATFPRLNVLVNNAGIQRRFPTPPNEPWRETAAEIETNLSAPIHLSFLFAPHLAKQEHAAILNVSSGLAFAPMAMMPVYCATKAAVHSFTLSLRHALAKQRVDVIEIIPPAVNTDLGGVGLHTWAVPLDEFADAVMTQLDEGSAEIAYGTSAERSRASRAELDEWFARMNDR
jgi:uncharacterized oxidoreductase